MENQREDKAGTSIPENAKIEIKRKYFKICQQRRLKLEKAMNHFDIELQNKVCMDIGASTGGFTDCMLQKRCKQSLCGRCRIWTVCMETANR